MNARVARVWRALEKLQVPGQGRLVATGAALGQRQLDQHLHSGQDLRARPASSDSINRLVVSPSFFDTMGLALKTGRVHRSRHDAASCRDHHPRRRKYFLTANPIGQRFGNS